MKDNRMSSKWHTPIKFILYIWTEFKRQVSTLFIQEKRLAVGLVRAPITLKFPKNLLISFESFSHY